MNNIEITRTRPFEGNKTFKYEVNICVPNIKEFDEDVYYAIEDFEKGEEYVEKLTRPVLKYISKEVFGIELPFEQDSDVDQEAYPISANILDSFCDEPLLSVIFELPQPFPLENKVIVGITKFLKKELTTCTMIDVETYIVKNPREIKS